MLIGLTLKHVGCIALTKVVSSTYKKPTPAKHIKISSQWQLVVNIYLHNYFGSLCWNVFP